MARRKTTGPKGEKKVTRYTYDEIKEPRSADRAAHVRLGSPPERQTASGSRTRTRRIRSSSELMLN